MQRGGEALLCFGVRWKIQEGEAFPAEWALEMCSDEHGAAE